VAAEGKAIDALGQFELQPFLGPVGEAVRFSQSNAHMLVAVGLISGLMIWGMARRAIIPGRAQAAAEMAYDFIHNMVTGQIGHEGKRYFPFVFSLFMFVLFGNLIGLLPFAFTFTSHIAVTFTLAVVVFIVSTLVGIAYHGLHWFTYFAPGGAPKALLPVIIPIEIISYLSRPISLSVRLFANMVAGHVMLKVFATFVVMIGSAAGIIGVLGATLPLAMNVALIGFELLVAFLQAYVFAILTSIYLHDAVHLH
jgi:F-type H+-transporting ATPase subunit a